MKPHLRFPLFRVAAPVLAVGLLIVGCAGDSGGLTGGSSAEPDAELGERVSDAEDDGLLVVATTSILGDVARNVVGDDGRVETLMPAGVDPHGFQPSASDAARLREADLVIAVGLGLEENLVDALAAGEADGVPLLELAEHLDPLGYANEDEHAEDEHAEDGDAGEDEHDHAEADDHEHGPLDPHVWFDPVRMADGARVIADELAALGEGDWADRGDAYAEQILAVHAELESQFGALPETARRLVTNHDSLGYLAHRYDFEILGTVVPGTSNQAEADARAFAELAETIDEAGVAAIFTENIEASALADQLAGEVSGRGGDAVEVVSLYTDALGESGSGAETYLDLLRENARRIVEGLA